MVTLLTLPPHLLEVITSLIRSQVEIPQEIRVELEEAKATADRYQDVSRVNPEPLVTEETSADNEKQEEDEETEEDLPPTIGLEVVEKLSRWASSEQGIKALRREKMGRWYKG
jgi:hypothetical protein